MNLFPLLMKFEFVAVINLISMGGHLISVTPGSTRVALPAQELSLREPNPFGVRTPAGGRHPGAGAVTRSTDD